MACPDGHDFFEVQDFKPNAFDIAFKIGCNKPEISVNPWGKPQARRPGERIEAYRFPKSCLREIALS
jgi:hypothetical protein